MTSGRPRDVVGRRYVGEPRPAAEQRPRYIRPPVTDIAAGPAAAALDLGLSTPAFRVIYLDTARCRDCVDRMAATSRGREYLAPSVLTGFNGVVGDYNPALLLTRVAAAVDDAAIDLCNGRTNEINLDALHPAQVLGVRGRVRAVADVTPSSFLLASSAGGIRILVDRAFGLHLNQKYLTGHDIYTVGIVQSVPRKQLRAAAVCIREEASIP